jgi:hypothetical protein
LLNRTVLVTGGHDQLDYLSTAALYDLVIRWEYEVSKNLSHSIRSTKWNSVSRWRRWRFYHSIK